MAAKTRPPLTAMTATSLASQRNACGVAGISSYCKMIMLTRTFCNKPVYWIEFAIFGTLKIIFQLRLKTYFSCLHSFNLETLKLFYVEMDYSS